MVVNIWKWFHISNLLLFLLMFFLFFFCSFCMIFFDIHKHETIMNDNMVYNDSLQSSSSSSGERECCKVGRNNFSLVFVATVSYGRRGYICHQNERVSEWVSDGNNRILILFQFLLDVLCATYSLFRCNVEHDKHLTIISGWRMKKQSFSLQKYLIRCHRRIMKT